MDIAISQIDGCFQLALQDGDLLSEQGLETSIIISLFSDARITEDELPSGLTFKRGWWGDVFPDFEGDKIGSKIWVLDRNKVSLSSVAQIENYARESLQWLLEDGAAQAISVEASINESNSNQIDLSIKILRPTGENDRFGFIWDEQQIKRA